MFAEIQTLPLLCSGTETATTDNIGTHHYKEFLISGSGTVRCQRVTPKLLSPSHAAMVAAAVLQVPVCVTMTASRLFRA